MIKIIDAPIGLLLQYLPQYLVPFYDWRLWMLGGDEHDTIDDYEVQSIWSVLRKPLGNKFSTLVKSVSAVVDTGKFMGVTSFNEPHLQNVESPSANGLANAESMAKLGGLILTGELFGAENSKEGFEPGERILLEGIGTNITFSAAGYGLDRFSIFSLPGWAGWAGAGGSVLQFNAEKNLSFAYNTILPYARISKPRGVRLMKAVMEVIESRKVEN